MLDLNHFTTALLDMDGVLYRGSEPLPGVNELLVLFARRGIAYACVTNNAMLTPQQYEDKLAAMGIAIPAANVITSPVATRRYLETQAPRGTPAYYVGMEGLRAALFDDGYFVLDEQTPQFVIVGLDMGMTYAKMRTACLAIRAGARFVGTNPDTSLPTEVGIVPGAGSLLALLQAATDITPLRQNVPPQSSRIFSAAFQSIDWSSIWLKYDWIEVATLVPAATCFSRLGSANFSRKR